MTYRILVFLFSSFLIGNSGCRGGLFGDFKSLDDLAVPPHKAKLVVFANLGTKYTNIIYVAKTRSSLDTSSGEVYKVDSIFRDSLWRPWEFRGIDTVNATVEVFRNGVLFDSPMRGTRLYNSFNEYYTNEPIINDGATYKLRVSAAGFETVEAVQIMPNLTKLDSVKLLRKGLIINGLNYYPNAYEFMCFFKDSMTTIPNYYSIRTRNLFFDNELINLDLTINGNLLTDKNIDGKPFAWRVFYRNTFSIANANNLKDRIHFQFNSTTRDAYLFEQSSKLYFEAKNNKFAEPTILYSNIKNGYGIFTLSAVSEFYLRF